jgi:hypothetical protein
VTKSGTEVLDINFIEEDKVDFGLPGALPNRKESSANTKFGNLNRLIQMKLKGSSGRDILKMEFENNLVS